MLDLLEEVGLAVGDMHLDATEVLIDERLVAAGRIVLPDADQGADHGILGLGADVEIAGIEPAADIETRHVLAGLVLRVGSRALAVEIDMLVIDRRLTRIVAVAVAVPDAIGLVDQHMVHLDGQIDVEAGMPGVGVDTGIDTEAVGALAGIVELVEAGLADAGEVEAEIIVAEIFAPAFRRAGQRDRRLAGRVDTQQLRGTCGFGIGVEFDHRGLGLGGDVAELRVADHRLAQPAGNAVGAERPFHDAARLPRRQHAAQHEPAILRLIAAVEELEVALVGTNGDAACRIFGGEDQRPARGHRQRFGAGTDVAPARGIACPAGDHVACRIKREGAGLAVGEEALVEIGRGQEFQIESGFARERGGERLVEDHGDMDAVGPAFGADAVLELVIGIFEQRLDRAGLRIHVALHHPPDRVPLAGGGGEADIAVGGGALALLDDLDAADLRIGEQAVIPVGEDEDVDPARLEIAGVVQLEIGLCRDVGRHRNRRCQKARTRQPAPDFALHIALLYARIRSGAYGS